MTGAREYINAFRKAKPTVKTFLWGLHPSALPEKTLREEQVNFIVQGEGFLTITELLKRLKAISKSEEYNILGLWY
jgi:radical SAM superfamily enzyme YgiQ (UPF0313 family)